MFKRFFSIFKKDTLIDKAYQRSFEMLKLTGEMFRKAQHSLRKTENNQVQVDIYNQDIEINKYEREVRRNVLSHLITSGPESLPSGLVLVSIIIDIERIGDYTKNMVELALNHPGKLDGKSFEEDLVKIETAIMEKFEATRICFQKAEKLQAEALLEKYNWINRTCDKLVFDIINEKDSSISAGDSAALALYIRFLKRINSHLSNILTSIVNPFDRIGFKPKK